MAFSPYCGAKATKWMKQLLILRLPVRTSAVSAFHFTKQEIDQFEATES